MTPAEQVEVSFTFKNTLYNDDILKKSHAAGTEGTVDLIITSFMLIFLTLLIRHG